MNEILTASTGVVMSQSPGSGFPHFESCSWVVKVEPGYNVTFTIEHFQTSRQFDELEIFDGESATQLGRDGEGKLPDAFEVSSCRRSRGEADRRATPQGWYLAKFLLVSQPSQVVVPAAFHMVDTHSQHWLL